MKWKKKLLGNHCSEEILSQILSGVSPYTLLRISLSYFCSCAAKRPTSSFFSTTFLILWDWKTSMYCSISWSNLLSRYSRAKSTPLSIPKVFNLIISSLNKDTILSKCEIPLFTSVICLLRIIYFERSAIAKANYELIWYRLGAKIWVSASDAT